MALGDALLGGAREPASRLLGLRRHPLAVQVHDPLKIILGIGGGGRSSASGRGIGENLIGTPLGAGHHRLG